MLNASVKLLKKMEILTKTESHSLKMDDEKTKVEKTP